MKYLGIVLVSCISLASPVSASCAWVLWNTITGFRGDTSAVETFALDAYESKAECSSIANMQQEKEKTRLELQNKDPNKTRLFNTFTCLPDTVDPRGPKGK